HDLLKRAHELGEAGIVNVPLAAQHEVERLDLVAYEFVDPVQFALEICIGFKVPCHVSLLWFSAMGGAGSSQDQPAVHGNGLTHHVCRQRRGEKQCDSCHV